MTAVEFEASLSNATITLRPIAMKLTRDSEETKDLLQRTLMKAWINRHRFNPGTNLKAWLYTIMKNTFLSDYQKSKRRQTYVDVTDNQYYINSTQSSSALGADSDLNLDEIHQTISSLPDHLRLPFNLFLKGYKYEEISEQLSIPLGTVKNRIFLSRQELKHKLKYLFQIKPNI